MVNSFSWEISHILESSPCSMENRDSFSWQRLLPREFLQLPALRSSCHNRLCRTLARWQPTINWVPGWRPFYTNLLIFSSRTDFQLNWQQTHSLTNQILHVTSLNWTADNWLQIGWCSRYIISGRTQQKTPPPTILLFLSWRFPNDRLDIVSARTCLPTVA
jgi:hypothetical protein